MTVLILASRNSIILIFHHSLFSFTYYAAFAGVLSSIPDAPPQSFFAIATFTQSGPYGKNRTDLLQKRITTAGFIAGYKPKAYGKYYHGPLGQRTDAPFFEGL